MIYKEKDNDKKKENKRMSKLIGIIKEYSVVAFSLVLVFAGYVHYISKEKNSMLVNNEANKVADIGDATLVNSDDISENDSSVLDDEERLDNKDEDDEEEEEEKEEKARGEADSMKNTEYKQTNSSVQNEYFISSRLERENMYSQAIESYQKIIENPKCSAIERNNANDRINEINQIKNAIMITENLIKTKGIEDCVVFVNSGSINIILKKEELLKEDIAKVQNIAARELSADINDIHISNKY